MIFYLLLNLRIYCDLYILCPFQAKMSIQAFGDLFKFETVAEQAHVLVRMRRVWEPEDMPRGPALQRQNAMSYCDFREMRHMVDCVLRKPRCAALLREWVAGARSWSFIEDAREIRRVLVENVMWRWWWGEMLSEAQAEVVCLILFRRLGVPSRLCRRLVVCERWMVAYFRPKEPIDFPLNRLLNYGAAELMPEEFLEDARVASELGEPENERYFHLAQRVLAKYLVIQCHFDQLGSGRELDASDLAGYMYEDEEDIIRVCDWLALGI